MAVMIHFTHSGQTHYRNLNHFKNPYKEFKRECENWMMFNALHKNFSFSWVNENEFVMRWKDDYEWIEESFKFDENNNDIYSIL